MVVDWPPLLHGSLRQLRKQFNAGTRGNTASIGGTLPQGICPQQLQAEHGGEVPPIGGTLHQPAHRQAARPSVQRSDIAALHHDLRQTPYQANRTLGKLSKIFNLSEMWELRPDGSNPCRHVKRFKEEKRERFLSDEEYQRLGSALREIEQERSETPAAIVASGATRSRCCRRFSFPRVRVQRYHHRRRGRKDGRAWRARRVRPLTSRSGARAMPWHGISGFSGAPERSDDSAARSAAPPVGDHGPVPAPAWSMRMEAPCSSKRVAP